MEEPNSKIRLINPFLLQVVSSLFAHRTYADLLYSVEIQEK